MQLLSHTIVSPSVMESIHGCESKVLQDTQIFSTDKRGVPHQYKFRWKVSEIRSRDGVDGRRQYRCIFDEMRLAIILPTRLSVVTTRHVKLRNLDLDLDV